MHTVGAEGAWARELRTAGELVTSTHNKCYHTIYQLSIYIVRYLVEYRTNPRRYNFLKKCATFFPALSV
jgi:hypothetical protein